LEFGEFTLVLLLLFFPGIVSSQLYDALTIHRRRQLHETILHSFLFGVTAYLTYALLFASAEVASTLAGLLSPQDSVDFTAMLASTGLGIALAVGTAVAYNAKLLHRIAFRLGLTRKFGDLDVWSYMHNSAGMDWVTVRDWGKGLSYQGWVEAFSDTYVANEMLLREVVVCSIANGQPLYKAKALYVTQDPQLLTIEVEPLPYPKEDEGSDREATEASE